ncbi:MAG: Dehydrogenase [Acidimicrobiales bacterium]|nr:Dehydrogenase [Acidimicrobiales bacterium]
MTDQGTNADTPEQAAFREEVRAFLSANAEPKGEASMWAVNFHTDADDAARDFEAGRAWQGKLFANGLAGLTYPTELGGRGGQPWHETIYREEAAGFQASSGFIASTIAMLGPTLMKWGTDEQRSPLLPRLLSGEDAWCQLFSEPGAGSDLAGLATRAVRDGDEFVVSGQKVWNSAAQWCSKGMLVVRTDPDLPKHRGVTFLLVDMDSPGIEVRPLVQPTGAQHFNEVFLSNVRVPVANVLGEVNDGWHVARTVLSNESAFIGGGGRGSVYGRLVALARQHGRTGDPVIRQQLAAGYTREKLLDVMGERILAAVRRREVPPMDPSILKLYVAENAVRNGNLAMAIGGASVVAAPEGDEVSGWAQAELLGRFGISIGGGTNEVQRNNLAERALGLPREMRNDHEVPWREVPRS